MHVVSSLLKNKQLSLRQDPLFSCGEHCAQHGNAFHSCFSIAAVSVDAVSIAAVSIAAVFIAAFPCYFPSHSPLIF